MDLIERDLMELARRENLEVDIFRDESPTDREEMRLARQMRERQRIFRTMILIIIYISFFLDNVLLTVIVPIIPQHLLKLESYTFGDGEEFIGNITTFENRINDEIINKESITVGKFLSSKAICQLFASLFVGKLCDWIGNLVPLLIGTIILLASTLVYAFADSFPLLILGRSLHGFASAFICVTGMCIIVENLPEEKTRSKYMGIIMGSSAVGVLLGYPTGGFLYYLIGKTIPFLIIGILVAFNIGIQIPLIGLKFDTQRRHIQTKWKQIVKDNLVIATSGAILVSSCAIAILESALPLWIIQTFQTEQWQLGLIFVPDSIGYLIGTNFFGPIAYKVGPYKVAITVMIVEAGATIAVPFARSLWALAIPHVLIGFATGVVDASLVPHLGNLVDTRYRSSYGFVYSLQQTAVSLAYCVGPFLGGEMVSTIGFSWLMYIIGAMNFLYCPLLFYILYKERNRLQNLQQMEIMRMNQNLPDNRNRYARLDDEQTEYNTVVPYLSQCCNSQDYKST